MMVEERVHNNNCGYMDAIIDICEENKIDLEDVKKYISNTIKAKVEFEAQKLNFLGGVTTNPLVD